MNYKLALKSIVFLLASTYLLFSCKKKDTLNENFNCNKVKFTNLEWIKDVNNQFAIPLPKKWKVNLFIDEMQSAIFAADTTKQLTETVLIDVSVVSKDIEINDLFKLDLEQENLLNKLIQTKTKEIQIFNKPGYFAVFKGIKNKFSYQKIQLYAKLNSNKIIVAKVDVYGDSLAEYRACKAFALIDKIKLLEND